MISKTIWFISKYYASPPNEGSGSSRVFLTMREICNLGNRVIIFTSSSDPYAELETNTSLSEFRIVNGIKFWLLRGLKYKNSISLSRIFSWLHFEYVLFRDFKLEKSKPEVIIISSPSILTIFNGLYLKQKFKAKLIFEVRDIWPLTLVADAGISRYNPFILLMGLIEKIAYKYSHGIIGTMPNLRLHVKNILGYDKSVGFAPMGISAESFNKPTPLDNYYIEKFIPKNKFLIVYSGTIGVANALETLFSCASLLITENDIHFLIVGDGSLVDEYKSKYQHLANLSFSPKINKSSVQALLNYADLLYFSVAKSEVWEYGQSLNKVIDYMISGKPIIASYSGFQSMINESGCGVFVPADNPFLLAEEIKRLHLVPKEELNKIGSRGREWLKDNRDYKVLAKNYLNYINKV